MHAYPPRPRRRSAAAPPAPRSVPRAARWPARPHARSAWPRTATHSCTAPPRWPIPWRRARRACGSVDGTWSAASDRWINVYADDQDGTDESMATQFAFPVAAGTHTFDLYAARYDGRGEVTMSDPVLTVAAVPAAAAAISRSSRAWPIPRPRHADADTRLLAVDRDAGACPGLRLGVDRPLRPARGRSLRRQVPAHHRRPIPVEYRALDRHRRRCRRRHRPQPVGAMGQRARPRRVRLRPAGRPLPRQRRGSRLQRRDPRVDAAGLPPVPRRCRAALIALLSVPPAHRRARHVRPASARARGGSAGRSRRRTAQAARRAAVPRSCR